MTWVKLANGNYLNLGMVTRLLAVEPVTGQWRISVSGTAANDVIEAGPYASEADAQDAIRKLTLGVDASTVI
jgi:hypothetical protein